MKRLFGVGIAFPGLVNNKKALLYLRMKNMMMEWSLIWIDGRMNIGEPPLH